MAYIEKERERERERERGREGEREREAFGQLGLHISRRRGGLQIKSGLV